MPRHSFSECLTVDVKFCPPVIQFCVSVSFEDPSRLHYGPAVVVESAEQFSTLELLHRLPGDGGILLELATHSSNYSVRFYFAKQAYLDQSCISITTGANT